MNKLINTTNQTPIEIALQIDSEGMTTARNLYEFLELNPSNYSKWCKRNILENEFAEDGTDFYSYQKTSEGRGNFAEDFKLTAPFAKKLSMTAKNEKGEQARDYFVKTEDKLKEVVKKTNTASISQADKEKVKLMNARSRMANTYMRLANVDTVSKEYKNILVAKAAEVLNGTELLPLPKQDKKTYSATDIGNMLGVSSQKIGRIATNHSLKTEEYGEFYRDKSKYSSKEVDTFRYYDSAIPVFKKFLDK